MGDKAMSDYLRFLDYRVESEIFKKNMSIYGPCRHLFCVCPTVPYYSTDIREAWKVVDRITMPPDGSLPHGVNSVFVFQFNRANLWAMQGREVALWICETALGCVLSPISITDNGKPEKSTPSAEERKRCPSSKMGMSERSCFPTSTSASMIRITSEKLKKWGLHPGVEKLILRETEWQYLVYAGGDSVAKVWVHKHECEVI